MSRDVIMDPIAHYRAKRKPEDDKLKRIKSLEFEFNYIDTLLNIPIYVCDKYLDISNAVSESLRPTGSGGMLGCAMHLKTKPYYHEMFGYDNIVVIRSEVIDDQIRRDHVILHEIGHLLLEHAEDRSHVFRVAKEIEADIFAMMLGADPIASRIKSNSDRDPVFMSMLRIVEAHYLGSLTLNNIKHCMAYLRDSFILGGSYDRKCRLGLFEHLSKLSIR
jgi:IrrE N-terminal-like domain